MSLDKQTIVAFAVVLLVPALTTIYSTGKQDEKLDNLVTSFNNQAVEFKEFRSDIVDMGIAVSNNKTILNRVDEKAHSADIQLREYNQRLATLEALRGIRVQ